MTNATLYTRLGGAAALERLVARYLDILQHDPAYARLCAFYTQGFARYQKRMVE